MNVVSQFNFYHAIFIPIIDGIHTVVGDNCFRELFWRSNIHNQLKTSVIDAVVELCREKYKGEDE